jgi:Putative zinc-finger
MKLKCEHVWSYISDYLDDTVDPRLRDEIEKHLEHCEICTAILDSTRNILVLTADARTFELPVGFSERLHARLARELVAAKIDDPGLGSLDPEN